MSEGREIVAAALTNQAPDVEHLEPMLEQTIDNCHAAPEKFSADTGYFSKEKVDASEQRGFDPYIAVGRNDTGAVTAYPRRRPGRAPTTRYVCCLQRPGSTRPGASQAAGPAGRQPERGLRRTPS